MGLRYKAPIGPRRSLNSIGPRPRAVGVRSKQLGVSSAAGRTWAVPRSPQGVGGEDGIGDHVGGDLKWFIMNGFARCRGAGGNLGERVLGKIPKTDLGQGDRQSHFRGEAQDLLNRRAGCAFQDQLHEQPESDFLTMEIGVSAGRHGQAIVDGVGRRQAGGFKAQAGKQSVRLDQSFSAGVTTLVSTARSAPVPSSSRVL